MQTYRYLTLDDYDDITNVIEERLKQFERAKGLNAAEHSNTEQLSQKVLECLNFEWGDDGLPTEDNMGRTVGLFDDDELISFWSQKFYTRRLASWVICNFFTRPTKKIGNRRFLYDLSKIFGEAFDSMVEESEDHGYLQWFGVATNKGFDYRWQRLQKYSRTAHRYHFFTENIIPAGESSVYPAENAMLGYRKHAVPMYIRCAKLKPEFRHEYFKKKGLIDIDYVPLQDD
jgi:hypothetical protein